MINLTSPDRRILAQCTIDPLGDNKWVAIVTELEVEFPRKRIYTIYNTNENAAAREALARFEEDLT